MALAALTLIGTSLTGCDAARSCCHRLARCWRRRTAWPRWPGRWPLVLPGGWCWGSRRTAVPSARGPSRRSATRIPMSRSSGSRCGAARRSARLKRVSWRAQWCGPVSAPGMGSVGLGEYSDDRVAVAGDDPLALRDRVSVRDLEGRALLVPEHDALFPQAWADRIEAFSPTRYCACSTASGTSRRSRRPRCGALAGPRVPSLEKRTATSGSRRGVGCTRRATRPDSG